jgi:hypothetical protein
MSDYDSFGEWFIGPPGATKMFEGASAREGLKCDRPWIYGHLRTPEVIFQPAGGVKYPERRTATNGSLFNAMAAQQHTTYTWTTVYEKGADNSLAFDWLDAGMVEIIPYRMWASEKSCKYKTGMTILQPLNGIMMAGCKVYGVAPINILHDVVKTLTIPVAVVYYASD